MARKWKFLTHTFDMVDGRFSQIDREPADSDPVRIGRDVDDWWIDVQYAIGDWVSANDFLRYDQVECYRYVRETAILMASLARADYTSWLAALIRRAHFLPPKFMNLEHGPELPHKFRFYLESDLEPHQYAWAMLKDVFSADDYTDDFLYKYSKINKVAVEELDQEAVIAWHKKVTQPISIKLTAEPEETPVRNQVKILQNLTHTILQIQAAEKLRYQTHSLAPPAFRLECIELNLREFTVDAAVLKALQKLIETGVHIKSLTLPDVWVEDECHEAKLRLAWAAFLAITLGLRKYPNKAPVRVDHLVLPRRYNIDLFIEPFCSAVCQTTVLKSVRIEMGPLRSYEPIQCSVWGWLAYAFFSKASTNSVQTLDLDGFQLSAATLKVLQTNLRAADPLVTLFNTKWRQASATTHPYAVVAAKATLYSCGSMDDVQDVNPWLGIVLQDDPDQPTVDMFVPCFGFCTVYRKDVTVRRGAPVPLGLPSGISTLIVGCKNDGDEPIQAARFIPALLSLVGAPLTGLALEGDDLNDKCVIQALHLCRRLQSLRVRGATLKSMDVFGILYQQPQRSQLSSLDLRELRVPIASFEDFLGLLATRDHPIVRTLRRLRVGKEWGDVIREQTDQAMERMLSENRMLTHFHLYTSTSFSRHFWNPHTAGHNGVIVSAAPFPAECRLAFLSVLQRKIPTTMLTTELIAQIWEYAEIATCRQAYSQLDEPPEDW